ncbi:MAG TPA: amidohydrolase family protein [Frankiaceae bacterium]|jgi:predicted TIM-barrel fold metal-dependent hydrolase|nr:amidohydrolase family protein [Frankiaceae bacterium]
MLPDDARVISVDDHIIEHPRVWADRLPSHLVDRGPKVVPEDGVPIWWYDGNRHAPLGLDAVAGDDPSEFKLASKAFELMRPGCYDPVARLKDMDADGIDASLAFPQFPRFAGQAFLEAKDRDLALLCVRAWNDFVIDEWCATSPQRLIPLSIVPMWDAQLAADEVRRTAALGSRAITFSENPAALGLSSFWSSDWDPLFAALEETGNPLCLHIGSSSRPIIPHGDAPIAEIIALLGLLSMQTLVDLLLSPLFERHPRLTVMLSEGGIGWVPYVLERLEQVYDRHRHHSKINVKMTPTESFREHVWTCFIRDEAGIEARHRIGVDKIMFEGDYPHSDSVWPNSRKSLAEQLANVPDGEARLIAGETAAKLLRV